MVVKSPHERPRVETTPEAWAQVVEWRPFIYRQLARFGAKVTKRNVSWQGEIGTPSFKWLPRNDHVYGVNLASLLQDLEYRALEAAVRAVQTFDPGRGFQLSTYLGKVIDNALHDEFQSWVASASSTAQYPLEEAEELEAAPLLEPEPAGLDPETEAALQRAMGVLTSREAWALRMHADDLPIDVIAERLGHKNTTSTYALIRRAKRKANAAFEGEAAQ